MAVVDAKRPAFVNEMGLGAPIQLEPVRQYTLGVLAHRLHDTASATTAAAALQRLAASASATALTRDLDRGLRARLALFAGRAEDALHLLDALESRDSQGDIAVIPFVARANERPLRAEVLASLGRSDEALKWLVSLGDGAVSEISMRATSHLRQAEIHDGLGHLDQAASHRALARDAWRGAEWPGAGAGLRGDARITPPN